VRDIEDHHVLRTESPVEVMQVLQAADQQARADEQQQRHRHLRRDQRAAQSLLRCAARLAAAGSLQRRRQIDPRRAQRRREAEADAGEHADRDEKHQDTQVGRQIEPDRRRTQPDHAEQGSHAPVGDADAGQRTERREHHALGEQLTHQPGAAAADRQAHADLAAARRGARQQQIRDVGARDHEHEGDDRHDDAKRCGVRAAEADVDADVAGVERDRVSFDVVANPPFGFQELLKEHGHRRLRLIDADAGLQASDVGGKRTLAILEIVW